jgi:hypothetical protein
MRRRYPKGASTLNGAAHNFELSGEPGSDAICPVLADPGLLRRGPDLVALLFT